jgi:hypothetical protein
MPRPAPRLCAVSVDLDEIPNYFDIHGLTAPDGLTAHAVYRTALARLDQFAASEGIPLTLFAIAADLRDRDSANTLRSLADHGHEIANHSLDHFYDLTRLDPGAMRRQVVEGAALIEKATGVRPRGFRSPGYVVTDALIDVLREAQVLYDSSVFPCPAYHAAKAAAMAAITARGRSSRSIVDHPRALLAPTRPYRLGRPYTRRGEGPIELPIQVTRGLRLPYIGTSLTLAGPRGAQWLTRMVVGEPLVNLELHGIDLLDTSDGLQALVAHQPDVRVPLDRKLLVLAEVVRTLRGAGYAFVRLDEAAVRIFPS